MPLYVISYDLRKQRNYDSLLKTLRDAGAVRMLASLWLANLAVDACGSGARRPAPAYGRRRRPRLD